MRHEEGGKKGFKEIKKTKRIVPKRDFHINLKRVYHNNLDRPREERGKTEVTTALKNKGRAGEESGYRIERRRGRSKASILEKEIKNAEVLTIA